MKYKELLEQLQQLNEDQLNMDVSITDVRSDEYHQLYVELVYAGQECEIFGLDQPIIRFWGTEMTTKLVDDYVNFIMDSMSQQIKEEMLYEYLVNEYKDLSEKELTQQILENYGDEWFEYVKENNWNDWKHSKVSRC